MSKPRVKCGRVSFHFYSKDVMIAYLDRLSEHPRLGAPRSESQTRTSRILRIDFEKMEMETMNTIYWWED